ncbi:MAG: universal stress protein [Acidobacteriota bacterium]|jgi:nucleotide-binding universal stress UspA family protein
MRPIRTILCSVDLSPFSRREVELAVELARAFGAGLVLHHNLPSTGYGMAKSWEWKQEHPGADAQKPAEETMSELAAAVPEGVPVETLITGGPLALGIAGLAEELPADLLLLGCHGCSTEEHSSLTENLMRWCDCPLLVVHEGEGHEWFLHVEGAERRLRFLVPTDFSPASREALRSAYWLAERLPAEIHLLHVLGVNPPAVRPMEPVAPAPPVASSAYYREAVRAEARERMAELVPEGMEDRVVQHVEPGRAEDVILQLAEEVRPDLILMGEHARDLLHRFFTHDTAKGVLHRAACPVWFAPPPKEVAA